MAPAVKMPLPPGKLGMVFSGNPPTVKKLSDASPMKGKVKPGYVFEALILSDGTTFEGLTTNELVSILNEFADEEGRKMKLKMGLPNETELVLPPGDIGATISDVDGMPIVSKLSSTSVLKQSVRIGMCVDSVLLEDGTQMIGYSPAEVEQILKDDEMSSSRTVILKNPKMGMSSKSLVLPKKKEISLPTGKLGVSFKTKEGATTVASMKADSPMRGSFRVGMAVDSFTLTDGTEFRGLNARDLSEALKHSAGTENRKMLLKNPSAKDLPKLSTTKVLLPDLGDATEMGLTFAGTPAVLKEVTKSSPLFGKARRGQVVLTVGWGDGTEYDDLESEELEEILDDSSGSEGRYLVLKNLPAPLPDVVTVALPPGKIGVVFKGTPPAIVRISDTSPIIDDVFVGLVADTLTLEEGKVMYEMDTKDFTGALAAAADSESRVVRFINPATMDLTPGQDMERPEEMEIELPTGKLGVMFKGKAPCKVSSVNKTSPLRMDLPAGMCVDAVTVGKLTYVDLDAMELAGILSASSEVEGRVLLLKDPDVEGVEFQTLPDSKEVPLPSGMLGVVFKGSPPVPSSYKEGSKVEGLFPTGMFVDMVTLSDGTVITGLSTGELVSLLKETKDETERTLLFKNPKTKEPSPAGTILPDEKKIELPTGKLGVSFKGKHNARASRIHETSAIKNMIRVGMVVDMIELPDGKVYSGLTAKECAHVLADTKEIEGRIMTLKNPMTSTMSRRNIMIDDDDDAISVATDIADEVSQVG